MTGGCGSSNKVVKWLMASSGSSRKLLELGPCEKVLSPIMSDVEALVNTFESKDYSKMLKDLASALDKTAKALQTDSCNLKNIGDLIGKLSPKLLKAVVKVPRRVKVLKSLLAQQMFMTQFIKQLRLSRKATCLLSACKSANFCVNCVLLTARLKACVVLERHYGKRPNGKHGL